MEWDHSETFWLLRNDGKTSATSGMENFAVNALCTLELSEPYKVQRFHRVDTNPPSAAPKESNAKRLKATIRISNFLPVLDLLQGGELL